MNLPKYLDYEGLKFYHELVKKLFAKSEVGISDMKLTDDNQLNLEYTKGEETKTVSTDLSPLYTYPSWNEM